MTKTILTPTTLKTITKNGDFLTIIKMLTSQSVGKVELICKPFNVTDDKPTLKGTIFDKLVNTKFVLDFENLTYNKITDGKDDISKSENRQELISDFSDLIKASDKNNYSSIILYKNQNVMKVEAYGKPKQGVQNNYPKEIAQQTGTRESSVATWLKTNEVDPMTILQGVGSGRIKRQDFVEALLSDEGTLEFLKKYNSDGKWSSVWKATLKNTQESLSEMIRRVIKEESYDKTTQEEVDTFFKNFYTAMNNLEIIQKLTKNDKFRIYIRKMDDMANEIIKITG